MATKAQVETTVRDLEFLVAIAPFDQAKAAIEAAYSKLATAQQVAQARMVAGSHSNVSLYDSWVAENFVYFPNGKILVTHAEYSPILKHASKATDAHRSGKEFYISDKEAANLEKLAESGEVYTLKQNKNYKISTKKFAQCSLARFLFGDTATDYAKFLRANGVKAVPVWLAGEDYQKQQKAPFARALWFCNVGDRSDLDGSYSNLHYNDRAYGVRKASAERAHAKITEVAI